MTGAPALLVLGRHLFMCPRWFTLIRGSIVIPGVACFLDLVGHLGAKDKDPKCVHLIL